MTIIEALKDRNLLGQFLPDPSTWTRWLVFLKAFFALRHTKKDVQIYREATQRAGWPSSPAKESWVVAGTRAGKSYIIALLAAFLAAFQKYKLSPGETGYVLIVAPTRKQAGIIKGYLSGFFNESDLLNDLLLNETREEIELTNGITIMVLSSDYRSIRGFTAIAAIVDEVAFLSLEGSKPDTEVVRALRSRLTSTGGPLIAISSPHAKRGELYRTHKRHFGKDGSPVLVWQADSLSMNPTLDRELINRAYQEDPEASAADYGAQFRSDIESFINREALEAVTVKGRHELPPIDDGRYCGFTDPAGGSGKDSMTLCIGHDFDGVKVIDLVREVKPRFSPEQVTEEFSKILTDYRCSTVWGDRYAGEWPREQFRKHGVTYKLADKTKSELYQALLPDVNSGRIEILDNERLFNQVVNLERRIARGGKSTIDHPTANSHDDLANVLAGCSHYIQQAKKGLRELVWLNLSGDTRPKNPFTGL
jgi:hypothetical protein